MGGGGGGGFGHPQDWYGGGQTTPKALVVVSATPFLAIGGDRTIEGGSDNPGWPQGVAQGFCGWF
jgi:hypothetical protein